MHYVFSALCMAHVLYTLPLQTSFHGCGVSSHSFSATPSQRKHGTTSQELQLSLSISGGLKEALDMWVITFYWRDFILHTWGTRSIQVETTLMVSHVT